MPKVRLDFGVQKSDYFVKTVANIESVVKAILDRDVGPAVSTVIVDGKVSTEVYKCGREEVFKAVAETISTMERVGTGLCYWLQGEGATSWYYEGLRNV